MGRRARAAGLLALAGTTLATSGCFSLGEDFERQLRFAFFEFDHLSSPWSPNGDRVLLGGGSYYGLACVNVATGETLTLAKSGVTMATFAPDGQSILCTGLVGEESTGLWIESTDNPEQTPLLEAGVDDRLAPYFAAWSPDGRWLAVSAGETLELVRPDLSERRTLSTAAGLWLAWSPDGRWLACNGLGPDAQSLSLDLVSVPDGECRRIAEGGLPSWSPDGRMLAYQSLPRRDGSPAEIRLVDASGENSRFLCKGYFPRWSTRTDEILVRRYDEGQSAIFVVAADGSGERRLANGNSAWWSPDGSLVSFYREDELFLIGADGTGERSLGRAPGPLPSD